MAKYEDLEKVRSIFGGMPGTKIYQKEGEAPTVEMGQLTRPSQTRVDTTGRAVLEREANSVMPNGQKSTSALIAAKTLAGYDTDAKAHEEKSAAEYQRSMAVQGLQNQGGLERQGLVNTGQISHANAVARNTLIQQGDKARLDRLQQQEQLAGQAFIHGLPAQSANTLANRGVFSGGVPQAFDANKFQALRQQGAIVGGQQAPDSHLLFDTRTGEYKPMQLGTEEEREVARLLAERQAGLLRKQQGR